MAARGCGWPSPCETIAWCFYSYFFKRKVLQVSQSWTSGYQQEARKPRACVRTKAAAKARTSAVCELRLQLGSISHRRQQKLAQACLQLCMSACCQGMPLVTKLSHSLRTVRSEADGLVTELVPHTTQTWPRRMEASKTPSRAAAFSRRSCEGVALRFRNPSYRTVPLR